jgi:membrane fusion protein (multidrug efflux system)
VKVGTRLGGLWTVTEGLRATDRVIVEGRQKVKEGMTAKSVTTKIQEDGTLAPVAAAPAPGASDPPR